MALSYTYSRTDLVLIQGLRGSGYTWEEVARAMGKTVAAVKDVAYTQRVGRPFRYKKRAA